METGLGLGREGLGVMEGLGGRKGLGTGACLAKSSVCLSGSKPEHAVYLHISVQYIKYSLVVLSKKYFFFLFSFF